MIIVNITTPVRESNLAIKENILFSIIFPHYDSIVSYSSRLEGEARSLAKLSM